jgi:hypothetical protein
MAQGAGWRQVFDTGERAVATVLETGLQHTGFTVAMTLAVRARRRAYGALDGVRTSLLHVAGMAAVRDVKALGGSLRRIEGQLRELTDLVEDYERREHQGDGRKSL